MSGPKCGQAHLNAARRRELQLQREREERRQRATQAHGRDVARLNTLRQSESRIATLLGLADDILRSRRDTMDAASAADRDAWEARRAALETALTAVRAQLAQATTAFEAASEARRRNAETYQAGHFDNVSLGELSRDAEYLLQELRRLVRQSELRQTQQAETDRTRALAHEALAAARAAVEQVEALPHERLAPGLAAELAAQLSLVEEAIARGDAAGAQQSALAIRERAAGAATRLAEQAGSWLSTYDRAGERLAEARLALDQERKLLGTWAADTLGAIEAELAAMLASHASAAPPAGDAAALSGLETRVDELLARLGQARETAAAADEQQQQRQVIAAAFVKALKGRSFEAGARLADKSDPHSEVLIQAVRSGGREMNFRVDADGRVTMDLDDGVNGADCVDELLDLIDGVAADGVEFEVSDWGHATPERVAQAQAQRTGRRGAASASASGRLAQG